MSTYYALPRRYPGTLTVDPAVARDRSVRRRIFAAWGLLYLNTMTFVAGYSVLVIPSKVGKGLAQAALPLAIVLLLTVNPRLRIRPSLFLFLVSALAAETILTAVQIHHIGTAYRTFRLVEFATALWLLTPWFGRPDMLLLRIHLRWLYVSLGLVFLGLLVSPGKAFAYDGRLTGAIWPMLPTQIAQYAAMAAGITIVLWLGRRLSGRAALGGVLVAVTSLLLTHTRTGLLGLVVGIVVAGLSLFARNARVRRFFAGGTAVVLIGAVTVAGVISTWLARGQSAQSITSLTGRTSLWSAVLNTPRNGFQEIFGFGLSNAGVNGLPIDSNWLSSYMQEGLFGVIICALILIFLFGTACFRPSSPARAVALFIVTYCAVASFTEDAFTGVSTYLLELTVAVALLAAPALRRDG
jgi:O-antigen ligase